MNDPDEIDRRIKEARSKSPDPRFPSREEKRAIKDTAWAEGLAVVQEIREAGFSVEALSPVSGTYRIGGEIDLYVTKLKWKHKRWASPAGSGLVDLFKALSSLGIAPETEP